MCDHTQQRDRILRLFEDWLLVAHPDVLWDLERHLRDSGSQMKAIDVVNILGALARRGTLDEQESER